MRMLRRVLGLRLPFAAFTAVAALGMLGACSSSSSDEPGVVDPPPANPNARAGEVHGADTWKDGTVLTGNVTIAKDGNVTIEPGAKVTCADGATLHVQGTLRAQAKANHAKITCTRWAGLVVSAGGLAELEGVDLENGLVGIATAPGALDSVYTEGSLVNSLKPFVVSKDSKLTLANVKATTPAKLGAGESSQADVEGVLVASRLDYDAQASEGISVRQGGQLDLQDSTIHGSGGADLVSAYGAKKVKLSYSTFKGSHCGIHIEPSESFEIDHVTSESTYGITIYGSGAGPNTVKASNLTGAAAWLDFAGENGAITFENVFTTGTEVLLGGPVPPTITKASAPVPDAKPR
jgi:hypothetical protein